MPTKTWDNFCWQIFFNSKNGSIHWFNFIDTNLLLNFTAEPPPAKVNPCLLGICGPNSECHDLDGRAVCSCAFGMLGAPPNCRPECVIHQECPSNRACIAQQCQDPCIGSCGFNAKCITQNHQPICSCIEGFEGDPYASCNQRQSEYHSSNLFSLFVGTTYYIVIQKKISTAFS